MAPPAPRADPFRGLPPQHSHTVQKACVTLPTSGEPFMEADVVVDLASLLQLHGIDHDFQANTADVLFRTASYGSI